MFADGYYYGETLIFLPAFFWSDRLQVEFQTTCGQMIDLITTIEGEKDLPKYSLDL